MKEVSSFQQSKRAVKNGFTLLEILVAVSISVLIVISIYGVYVVTSRSYHSTIAKAELAQNGRIALERLSRDIRQASDIVTTLPPTNSDLLNPPPNHLLFQDGHYTYGIRYIEYRLNSQNLSRKVIHYYFSSDPTNWVLWNAQDQFGNPPLESVDLDEIKADKIFDLDFYGTNLVNIDLSVTDTKNTFYFKTISLARNI